MAPEGLPPCQRGSRVEGDVGLLHWSLGSRKTWGGTCRKSSGAGRSGPTRRDGGGRPLRAAIPPPDMADEGEGCGGSSPGDKARWARQEPTGKKARRTKDRPDRQEPGQLAPHKGERPGAPAPGKAGVQSCWMAPPARTAWGPGRVEEAWPPCPAEAATAGPSRAGEAEITKWGRVPPRHASRYLAALVLPSPSPPRPGECTAPAVR